MVKASDWLHCPFDTQTTAVQENGTWGDKAKPLAAYRRRLCCLAATDTPKRASIAPRGFASPLPLLYIFGVMSLRERHEYYRGKARVE
jgi:hypothetical protein